MVEAGSQEAFPTVLRRWRARRGWSQLDLAVRAGTTQRHLSFLEQGRSRPGRDVVARVAEALDLTLRERNELLGVAGYAPIYAESDRDASTIRATLDALSQIVEGHLPYPAVVVRPYGEVVFANAALAVLLGGVAGHLLEAPMNVLRVALHPEGMAPRVVNLAQWGRHIINSLSGQAMASPADDLSSFIDELESYMPKDRHPAQELGFAVPLRFRVDNGELCLITTLTSFATAIDVTLAELTLEAFLPGDTFTGEFLRTARSDRQQQLGKPLAAG